MHSSLSFALSRTLRLTPLLLSLSVLGACTDHSSNEFHDPGAEIDSFRWNIPAHLPLPQDNPDNPVSEAKFQLGRHLFYDRRLSGNGSQACVDCHEQAKAFSDGKNTPSGSTGHVLTRNSQQLSNIAYNTSYTWANISLVRIEQQILIPLFAEAPVEHGLNDENKADVLATLASEPLYQQHFSRAFEDDAEPVNYNNVVKAIAVFVRGLNSFNSPYDAYLQGNQNAISAAAKRGEALFFGETFECFHCHGGFNFTDSSFNRTQQFAEKLFHNTGLYNIGDSGDYPDHNRGIFELTGNSNDMGRFKTPSLRNIEVTAPYNHDGSTATLEEVIDNYANGGRNISKGPLAGNGQFNPFKDGLITGFDASEQDKADLVDFLKSLTDQSFLDDPRFANPWPLGSTNNPSKQTSETFSL
jgi:cytochrome c peroxidase